MLVIRHVILVYLYLAAQLATIANGFLGWHHSATSSYSRHNFGATDRVGTGRGVRRDANPRGQASSISNTTSDHATCVESEIIYISRRGDTAGHMVGSSGLKAVRKNGDHIIIKKFKSFKNQWMEETSRPWPSKCSTKGCDKKPTVGAHVIIREKEHVHLVSMCQKCNIDKTKNLNVDEQNNNADYHDRNNRPRQFNDWKYPILLDNGTPCVELTHLHISEQQIYMNIDVVPWPEMYKGLVAYSKKHKSTLVPYRYEPDRKLGLWVGQRRNFYKTNALSQDRLQLLEAIGFVWDVFDAWWQDMYEILTLYKEREGHCDVPQGHKEDEQNLGAWLQTQRREKKNGNMDATKEKQLVELGVVWDVFSQQWEDMYTFLIQYEQREGHCNVPRSHKEDGNNLGYWLTNQRTIKKNGKLDDDRLRRLEEIGIE